MDAYQSRRTKTKEPDRIGNLAFATRFDQRLVESDVGASAAQTRFNDAKRLVLATHISPFRFSVVREAREDCPSRHCICRRTLRISRRFSLNG